MSLDTLKIGDPSVRIYLNFLILRISWERARLAAF